MEPKISNIISSGLYANLPKINIASVDLSSSELTISKQITGKSTSATGSLTLTIADALDTVPGITSVFFESFDAERYSIHYSDGTTDDLTSGKFTLGLSGSSVTFTGLKINQTNVTVNVTLKRDKLLINQKTLLEVDKFQLLEQVAFLHKRDKL